MNISEQKLNLFREIDQLPEGCLLELEEIVRQLRYSKPKNKKRRFGCMKGLVISMADDFDAPLADFQEYM